MTLVIPQGATCTVSATGVVDGNGAPLTLTNWTVHAVIREASVLGAVVAEWSTTPTGSQGQATISGSRVDLAITPAMSAAWTWTRGVLQCEITEPVSPNRVARIMDETVRLSFEAVR